VSVLNLALLMLLALGVIAVGAAAESVTFLVSPDTHFTSAGGVPDIEKVSLPPMACSRCRTTVELATLLLLLLWLMLLLLPLASQNARGVHDMNVLPGQPFPPASQWKGVVEAKIRGVVLPGRRALAGPTASVLICH
jgi:hypothetical protein